MIGNFEGVVTEMCWFIREVGPDDDLMRYATQVLVTRPPRVLESMPYRIIRAAGPATTEIWRSYFSAATVKSYNNVVQKFLNAYPQASLLATVYPNLMIG